MQSEKKRTAIHRDIPEQTMILEDRGRGMRWYDIRDKFNQHDGWDVVDGEKYLESVWIETTNDPPPTIEDTPGNDAKLTAVQSLIVGACGNLQKTLLSKNQDYGDSVFNNPIMAPELDAGLAIRVRMSDKIARIIQLTKIVEFNSGGTGSPAVQTESLADTWLDLAGYALLEYIRITRKV